MNGNDRHNDLNVTWTVIAGVVGCIVVFAFIVAVAILFQRAEQAQFREKIVAESPQELSQLRSEQEAKINSYRMVDEKRGLAAIPIDEAMQAFARDPAGGMRAIRATATTQPATTKPATQPTSASPWAAPLGGPRPSSVAPGSEVAADGRASTGRPLGTAQATAVGRPAS